MCEGLARYGRDVAMDMARTHRSPSVFHDRRRLRIGVLGGSFNPAHRGHGHVADLAVRQLLLDELWWLVSPQNPLKGTSNMAPFEDRFAGALAQANRCRSARRMVVSRVEQRLGTPRTAETVAAIRRRAPRASLFWVMGADNLAGFHRWSRPEGIVRDMAIVVVNRPGWRAAALGSAGASIAGWRMSPRRLAKDSGGHRWCFIQGPLNHLSATAIRSRENGREPQARKTV